MTRPPSAGERDRWGSGLDVAVPRTVEEAGEVVRAAEAAGTSLPPSGLGAHPGTADAPDEPPRALISAAAFADVVAYEPDDFTLGVGAGMPLATLRDVLAAHGQELAHDLARGAGGTVGGLVARAPYGPRAGSTGPLHALVLGVEGVRGGGIPFRSGGMVVKNVAGYQVHKLCVGSAGRLGLLTRVNFRLRSRPERRVARRAPLAKSADSLGLLAAWRSRGVDPAALAVLSGPWSGGADLQAVWILEGPEARVRWLESVADAAARAGGFAPEAVDADDSLTALAGAEEPSDAGDGGIARVAGLASQAPALHDALAGALAAAGCAADLLADVPTGRVIVRWSGTGAAALEPLHGIRDVARRFDAVARLVHLHGPARAGAARDLLPDPNAALARRIERAFDPHGVFGGGRAVAAAGEAP